MKSLLQWMIGNTWFKKNSALAGGIAAGMLFQGHCWRQIVATREAWGVERDTVEQILLAVVAASGIIGSYGLSIAKQVQDKRKDEGNV